MKLSMIAILMVGAMYLMVVKADGGDCVDDDGNVYSNGDAFKDSDGCNDCKCNDGLIGCTRKFCEPGCEANGVVYNPGESYIAEDGCNNCFCSENGIGACTLMAC